MKKLIALILVLVLLTGTAFAAETVSGVAEIPVIENVKQFELPESADNSNTFGFKVI